MNSVLFYLAANVPIICGRFCWQTVQLHNIKTITVYSRVEGAADVLCSFSTS